MPISLAAWLADYGYLALLGGTFLEGETILILAGFAAHQGHLDIGLVLLVAFVGGTAGDQFFFWFGRISGPRLLRRWPRLGAAGLRISPLLQRHDAALIFGIRFMYGLRIAGPIAMGALGVAVRRFSVFNVLGAAVWAVVIGGGGYFSGHALEALLGDMQHYEGVAAALLVGAVLAIPLWCRWKSSCAAKAPRKDAK